MSGESRLCFDNVHSYVVVAACASDITMQQELGREKRSVSFFYPDTTGSYYRKYGAAHFLFLLAFVFYYDFRRTASYE